MKEQPSKSSFWNHSSKRSKIASSCSSGVSPRRLASASTQFFVQSCSRCWRNASTRASLESKWRYSVAFADRGVRDHLVDSDGPDASAREQLVGAVEDALPRRGDRDGCHCFAHRDAESNALPANCQTSLSHLVGSPAVTLEPCQSGARRSSWTRGSCAGSSASSPSFRCSRCGCWRRAGTTPSGWRTSVTPFGSHGAGSRFRASSASSSYSRSWHRSCRCPCPTRSFEGGLRTGTRGRSSAASSYRAVETCDAELDDDARLEVALSWPRFLRALHALDLDEPLPLDANARAPT